MAWNAILSKSRFVKMIITNLSRKQARAFDKPFDGLWIQIYEPGKPETIKNDNIKGKVLSFGFWDIEFPVPDLITGELLPVISSYTCLAIVTSLMLHARDDKRNVMVNCRAGKSRSAAICKYAQDKLGMTWVQTQTEGVKPNKFVYDSLVAAHEDILTVIEAFKNFPKKERKNMNVATRIAPMARPEYILSEETGYPLSEDDEIIKKWQEIILNYENLQDLLQRKYVSARSEHYQKLEL